MQTSVYLLIITVGFMLVLQCSVCCTHTWSILLCYVCRYKIGATQDGPLVSSSVRSFVEQLGARTSAPGGGSASALVATVVSGCEWTCACVRVGEWV